jgi:hypothetical protein
MFSILVEGGTRSGAKILNLKLLAYGKNRIKRNLYLRHI